MSANRTRSINRRTREDPDAGGRVIQAGSVIPISDPKHPECRWVVRLPAGGLMCGFVTREEAEVWVAWYERQHARLAQVGGQEGKR